MRARCSPADLGLAGALLLALAGCAPEESHGSTGTASGAFDCEIFQPGSNPTNTGDGAITVVLDGSERVLAQGAAGYAVDGNGSQTLDPSLASYFAVQVFQWISETELEIFELRVLPDAWVSGADIAFDDVDGVGFFGSVFFDGNGNAVDAKIRANVTHGSVHLEDAGRDPRAPVSGWLTDVRIASE